MSKGKPLMFLGSSTEARRRDIPDAFVSVLNDYASVEPWWLSSSFQPTFSTLSALNKAAHRYDFGLFILTPDDRLVSRGKKGACARDNVLLELGLFLGALGPSRTFAVVQDTNTLKKKVRVPSDLAGIHFDRFLNHNFSQLLATVNAACVKIRQRIRKLGYKARHGGRGGKKLENPLVPPPSTAEEYIRFWSGKRYTRQYWAYNPSYEVEKQPGINFAEIINDDFVPFYKNITRAFYLFLTKDKAGKESLKYFHKVISEVGKVYSDIKGKLEVRERSDKTSSEDSGVYRGTRNGDPTCIVELTQKALSSGPGNPHYYLEIKDASIHRRFSQQFNDLWKKAKKISI